MTSSSVIQSTLTFSVHSHLCVKTSQSKSPQSTILELSGLREDNEFINTTYDGFLLSPSTTVLNWLAYVFI